VQADQLALVAALAGLGLLIGSFLNVVAYRLPRGESLLWPASHCPTCEQPARTMDHTLAEEVYDYVI